MTWVLSFILPLFLLAPLGASDRGVVILGSDDPVCSLNKLALWLDKYLTSDINHYLISDSEYEIGRGDYQDNVILLTSLRFPYKLPETTQPKKIVCIHSVFEASRIPIAWVQRFNEQFDFITVPNQFLVDVYKKSGVTTPIFVLPIGSFLEDWIDLDVQVVKKRPFVFIASGGLHHPRKNHELLIRAFIEAFGDSKDLLLKIQARDSSDAYAEKIRLKYNLDAKKNIIFHYGNMDQERYQKFFLSGNCLVNVSSGEGFSITPREALAVGMPAIITNNSAQIEICQSGYVRVVPSEQQVPAIYQELGGRIGCQWNPTLEDVKEALLDVYQNYGYYLHLAKEAKPWVRGYTAEVLAEKWATLLHPKEVVLGDEDRIEDGGILVTTSVPLCQKYNSFMKR